MKIVINDQIFVIENRNFSVEKLREQINPSLKEEVILSHLILNGEEIYENYFEYLEEHISNIETIEVVLKTQKENLDEMLLTANDYLISSKPIIEELANAFYQGPSSDSWKGLEQLLEAMQWLGDFTRYLDQNKAIYSGWNQSGTSEHHFRELLKSMNEAVTNSDPILIGDVLTYELIPIFQALQTQIQTVIDSEVKRDELN